MNKSRLSPSNWLRGPVPPDPAASADASPAPAQSPAEDESARQANGSERAAQDPPAASSTKNHSPENPTDEDRELVLKAQAGDTRAFDQLVTLHRGKVYAMIVNMVKNEADAWDLAQDAFIKAWKALPKFEARARFSTWLFRISHNVVYDWLRKRRIQAEGELNDEVLDADRIDPGAATAPHQAERPDQALQQSETRAEINAAIAKLSPGHREVILLREVQGLDYKEIADSTGNSIGTVMSRLHYARKKLQSYLTP